MISKVETSFVFPQWLAGFGATMLLVQLGFMGGWVSPTIAWLTGPDSDIPLDLTQASWVASLVNLGRFFGAFFGSAAAAYLGSKRAITVTLVPMTIGWSLIGLADNVLWLYLARLSSGIGLGMAYTVFPLYIGEVSMPEIRGALVSLATVGAPFGQVIASIGGSYLNLAMSSSIYLALCLFLMGLFFLLPDSPHYLIKLGDKESARKSIDWYRAGNGVDQELEAVEKFVNANRLNNMTEVMREFKSRGIKKATLQIILLFTFIQITGLNSILFYMENILAKADFTLISPSTIVIFVNTCGIGAAIVSIFLIDKCGRKFLLLVSSSGVTISMVGLMIYFMMKDANKDISNIQWVPMASMLIFVSSFFCGLMQVPSAILSETFPANIKCVAACIASITGATASFLSAKTYQPMIDLLGESYVFMIYAICSILIIPYTIFWVLETKGKSLQQIQDELTGNKNADS